MKILINATPKEIRTLCYMLDISINNCIESNKIKTVKELKSIIQRQVKKVQVKKDDWEINAAEIEFTRKGDEETITKLAKDIFRRPDNYSDYQKGSDASYYKFLKLLWIKFPNGKEERLVDFVNEEGY